MIEQASSLDEALRNSIKHTMASAKSEYAIVFLIDHNNKCLLPYYQICPIDLSKKAYEISDGILTNVIKENKTINILNYQNDDKQLNAILDGAIISELVCIPLITSNRIIGCVLFFNSNNTNNIDVDTINYLKDSFLKTNFELFNYSKQNSEVILSLKNIYKDFNNGGIITNVLKGINIDISKGEFLVLVGPSGCGKTTLLNIIGGMDNPSAGEVYFANKDLSKSNKKELTNYRKDNVGFVFQSYNLMPNLTAKQNLDLISELVDNPLDSLEVLRLVELEDKANNYPSQLSGGQQQRISIARALAKNPVVIMADEPTAALDYKTSIGVLKVLQNIVAQGKTLVMVTHNEEIAKLANRVIRLRDGKVYEICINAVPSKADELVW